MATKNSKPAKKASQLKPRASKCADFGLDRICDAIANGGSMTAIAVAAGTSVGGLSSWIAADAERSARVREARIVSARVWDEKAEAAIEGAKDAISLGKARELAQHYRWRASKIAPKDYGDKVSHEHAGPGGGPIQTLDTSKLSDAALQELLSVRSTETDVG